MIHPTQRRGPHRHPAARAQCPPLRSTQPPAQTTASATTRGVSEGRWCIGLHNKDHIFETVDANRLDSHLSAVVVAPLTAQSPCDQREARAVLPPETQPRRAGFPLRMCSRTRAPSQRTRTVLRCCCHPRNGSGTWVVGEAGGAAPEGSSHQNRSATRARVHVQMNP